MPPVIGFVAIAWGAITTAIAGFIGFGVTAAMVSNFLLQVGFALVVNALFAPKKASVGQRQASVLELALGEQPREAIFGIAATGGQLLNGWNDGNENEYETLVVKLADHPVTAITGYILEDRTYELTAQYAQNHSDFQDGGSTVLWIETRNGEPGQSVAPLITSRGVAAGQWTADEAAHSFNGFAYAVVRYKLSDKVWSRGRPRFQWVVKGARLYDPRKDSTVPGGSGAHRWGQWQTYEFSDNARLAHYNYVRGVWNYVTSPPQLMVGPGRSAEEAPPQDVFAGANLCDEDVALKAGGTEKRYRVSAVISAAERWIDMEEHFAAAMAGQLVERAGTIGVDPGVAKLGPYTRFTDADIISGSEGAYQRFVTRDKLINTVNARYISVEQLWEQASTPIRRSQADIDADGEVRDQTIDLVFVTSGTQAQRCAEAARKQARLQATAVVKLGPKFMLAEDGDWIEWQSDLRFGGGVRLFEVQGVTVEMGGQTQLTLKEVSAAVFAWNPATDELGQSSPYLPPGDPAAAVIENFAAVPVQITSSAGTSAGAIKATWTPPNDATITGVRLEYRPIGSIASVSITVPPKPGSYIISVLPVVDVDYEIRATPVVSPVRDTLTTAWVPVALSAPFQKPKPPPNFVGYQTGGDLIRWTWDAFPDTTLQYEIRCGPSFDFGRFVDRVYGGSTALVWPVGEDIDDRTFWIKTLHRSGVYSDGASLWIASPPATTQRNILLEEDFQADGFPGILHDLTRTDIGGETALELDRNGAVTELRGDYYAFVDLVTTFNARAWMEHRANAYSDDNTGAWENDTQAWEDDTTDWIPTLTLTPASAQLDAFIAVNAAVPEADLAEGWRFNNTLVGIKGMAPASASGVTYAPAKVANGAVVAGALAYNVGAALPTALFQLNFDVRLTSAEPVADATLCTLATAGGASFLRLFWRAADRRFVLAGDFAAEIALPLPWHNDDTVSVEVRHGSTNTSGAAVRELKLASRHEPVVLTGESVVPAA